MKILLVNKFLYPRGGAETYMLKLGEALEEMGHEVEYFGMYDEKNTVSNRTGLSTKNLDFHGKGLSRFLYPFRILYSFEAEKKLAKVLDAFQPDVVHLNNINFQLTPSIHYPVKKRNILLVQTVHDYQMVCPSHLFYSPKEQKPCTRCLNGSLWNCAKHRCIHSSLVKSILGTLEGYLYKIKKAYSFVDLFICPSHFLEEKLLEGRPDFHGRTFTLHNFIKPAEKEYEPNKNPYIFFAGRFSEEKGISLLAECARAMPDVKFVAAGSGPCEELLQNIPNLTLAGFLTGEKLEQMMGEAAAVFVPSVWFENCPLSILEAKAMGTPVITVRQGGMAELVEDGVEGALLEKPTVEEGIRAIRSVLDPENAKKLRENLKEKKKEIFTVKEYAKILVEKYEALRANK